jgi:6-phosphogluconolactonase (cycloisomerase 2 family)
MIQQNLIFSSLGDWVYAPGSSSNDNRITQFLRNTTTGLLSEVSVTIINNNAGISAYEIANDGLSLYAAEMNFHGRRNTFHRFSINSTTGLPTLAETYAALNSTNNWAQDYVYGFTKSPDGKHLYVAGRNQGSFGGYEINPTTGVLTRVTTLVTGSGGGFEFMGWIGGLISDITNTFVYVFAQGDSAINVFNRSVTGALTLNSTIVAGRDMASGVNNIRDGVVDSTNNYLITCSGRVVAGRAFLETGISSFSRNTSTGALTYINTLTRPNLACAGIVISPDDKFIYVNDWSTTTSIYEKNSSTGALTFVATATTGSYFQTFSQDMKFLYVAIHGTHRVQIFSRNETTGLLTLVDTVESLVSGVGCINSPTGVGVTPNDNFVYVTYSGTNGVCAAGLASFTRNTTTGLLTYLRKEIESGTNLITFDPGVNDSNYITFDSTGDTMVHKTYNGIALYQLNTSTAEARFAGTLPYCSNGYTGYNRHISSLRFNPTLRQVTCTTAPDWNPQPGAVTVVNIPAW